MKALTAFLMALMFASAAAAQEKPNADYLITKGTSGINVYAVTEHATKLIEGSPFFPTVGPNMISDGNHDVPAPVGADPFLFTIDPNQAYLYALYSVQYINDSSIPGGALYSYRLTHGVPKVVSFAVAGGYGGPPHYYTEFNFIVASAHYVFVSDLNGDGGSHFATISVYGTDHGVLTGPISGSGWFEPYLPAQGNPAGFVPIGLEVNADESFAYVYYSGPSSIGGPVSNKVAIYSLKGGSFNFLRSVPSTDMPLLKSHPSDTARENDADESGMRDQ